MIVCSRLEELFFEKVEHPKLDGLPHLGDPLPVPLGMKILAAFESGVEQAHDQRKAGKLVLRRPWIDVKKLSEEVGERRGLGVWRTQDHG